MKGTVGEGRGAGEVMPAPALPVLWMHRGCDAGESLAHGKHIPLGWSLRAVPPVRAPGSSEGSCKTPSRPVERGRDQPRGPRWGARAAFGPLPQKRELCLGSRRRGRAQPEPVLWSCGDHHPVGTGGHPQPRVPQQLGKASCPGDLRGCWKGTNEMNEWGSTEGRLCPRAKVLPAGRTGRGVGDRGGTGRSFGEGTRERISEGSKQLLRDAGLGELGTGCRWSTGKTGLFFSAKRLEIAKQGEIMQNILQKDPCP